MTAEGTVVSEPAPAKLNPFLRVLGRRGDGYHEVETLVQPVTLADGIRAIHRDEGVGLEVVGERAGSVPRGRENLVLRAAGALVAATEGRKGADLLLAKRIPVAAGLGGGSADAAATLRALDRLWGTGLGVEGLIDVAMAVSSDVPALLPGGPVLARGRGERVEPVVLSRTWWVVVPPEFGISAREAYAWWDEDGGPTGPDPGDLLAALAESDLDRAGTLLFNDLQGPVAARHPAVGDALGRLRSAGVLGAFLCGSGPAVAGLCRDAAHADDLSSSLGGLAMSSMSRR